jgi:hypothetical protein
MNLFSQRLALVSLGTNYTSISNFDGLEDRSMGSNSAIGIALSSSRSPPVASMCCRPELRGELAFCALWISASAASFAVNGSRCRIVLPNIIVEVE